MNEQRNAFYRERIPLICEKCGSTYTLSRNSLVKKNKKGVKSPFLCTTCMNKRLSAIRSELYQNLSEEEKERRSQNLKYHWNNLSENEMKLHKEKTIAWRKDEKKVKITNLKIKKSLNNMDPTIRKACSEKQSLSNKNRWKKLSDEEKKRSIEILQLGNRKYIDSLSEEERKVKNDNLQKHNKEWFSKLTKEEIHELYKSRSNKRKEYIKNLSCDEFNAMMDNIRRGQKEWWNNLSEEEQVSKLSLLHDGNREYWDKMDEKERKEKIDKLVASAKEWQNKLTDDEFEKMMLNIALNKNKSNDIPTSITKSESCFSNILSLNNINFKFQYYNIEKHPDFHNLFPKNPISGGKVSPYHCWDFIVYLRDKDILIDIDGSIHDPENNNFNVISNNGLEFNLSEYTSFRDSQRPYQTDGLDAYIIKAYNDKIEDDTIVQNVKTNEEIKFKCFMNILYFDNLSEKDKKEIIKSNLFK